MDSGSLPSLCEDNVMDLGAHIRRLTKDTAVKFTCEYEDPPVPESTTLDFVFFHTTIPVPRVRRVLHTSGGDIATVMDHIPGQQLRFVWPSMSFLDKLKIVLTIRDYIRQLRAIRHPRTSIPGPLAPGNVALNPRCQMMTGNMDLIRPECSTYAELSEWWNNRYELSVKMVPKIHVGVPREPFDDKKPMVLTHCDLNMRNFIVGDDGRLYLIDWEMSGVYPEWFEYVNWRRWLRSGKSQASKVDRTDRFWNMTVPFIAMGPYFKQERWFYRVAPVLHYH